MRANSVWQSTIGIVCTIVLAATAASAEICGDPDGNGSVTVTDGVQILRAAAELSSTCTAAVCDVDADGTISVTDGVNVLRRAAGLDANLGCGAEVTQFLNGVETSDGQDAVLEIGVAPLPGPDAPTTIGNLQGDTQVAGGGVNEVTIPFDASGIATSAGTAEPVELIIAIGDLQGNLRQGFFRIPLNADTGNVTITTRFAEQLPQESFLLCPATLRGGVLSVYGFLRQDPVPASAGTVQIALTFHPSQDLDLRLIEPGGEVIDAANPSSSNGGTLDFNSNPQCDIDGRNNESISYPGVVPPRGQYVVGVRFTRSCNSGGATFAVVVNNNGVETSFTGAFTRLDVGQTREVARFIFEPASTPGTRSSAPSGGQDS